MAEALVTGLIALVSLAVGVWSGGRLYPERKALKEEMELLTAGREAGIDSKLLERHIIEQLKRYLAQAKNRDHSVRRLLGELLGVAVLMWLGFVVVAMATGTLSLAEMFDDPDFVYFAFVALMVLVALWRIDLWIRRSWASRRARQFSLSDGPDRGQGRADGDGRAAD